MNARRSSFRLPLASPLRTATGTIDERRGWLLRVGERPRGLGEATPLPGFTETHEECDSALDAAVTGLREDDWPAAFAAVADAPAARMALATAALDRRAREVGEPLSRFLGGDGRETIFVNATVGDGGVEETVGAATAAIDAGFSTLKLKVGARSVAEDVARVRAVRAAVGEASLRLDANGAWSPTEAREALADLAGLDLEYVEQPLAANRLAETRTLRGDVPIALDESLTVADPRDVVAGGYADTLVLKPMALGGPDVVRGLAHAAGREGIDAVVSNTVDAVVARTAAVHIAASLADPLAAGLATADLLARDLGPDPAPVEGGRMAVPQAPGLGVAEVDADA
ncbi:MAG: o-succinylbenzoate synthase [Halanaeroarchaeum sp.]